MVLVYMYFTGQRLTEKKTVQIHPIQYMYQGILVTVKFDEPFKMSNIGMRLFTLGERKLYTVSPPQCARPAHVRCAES